MRAVTYNTYGDVSKLDISEVEKPIPGDNEVLIKVHAASINSWDLDMLTGEPKFFRLWGLFHPKYRILGADVAGQVVLVGKRVTKFLPGDFVFGDLSDSKWGGFAEYVCGLEDSLTLKPEFLSFEEAAALPQAGAMAWQGLTEKIDIKAGQKILINGAAGGVGSYAIQIAKNLGAEVTAVDKKDKFKFMKTLGADILYDYKETDYSKLEGEYDVILDVIGNHSVKNVIKVLKSKGHYIMVGGSPKRLVQVILRSKKILKEDNKYVGLLFAQANYEIERLLLLLEYGKIKSNIYKSYALEDIREAMQEILDAKVMGKIIIKIIE